MTDEETARKEIARRPLGVMVLSAMEYAEWRAAIREHLAEAEARTRTELASEIGLAPHVLSSLLNGGELGRNHAARVRTWARGRPRPHVQVEQIAIDLLTGWVRPPRLVRAKAELVELIRGFYRRYKINLPESVDQSLGK